MNWKKQRLHNLIQRLDQGNDVTLRDFKSAITSDEYEEYLYRIDWKNQINSFSYSSGYEDNLKKGIFLKEIKGN